MIVEMLKRHEGFRAHPYRDIVGKLTIGYGWNLDDIGITEAQAEAVLNDHIQKAVAACELFVPGWDLLDQPRRDVLTDMCFNMGRAGLFKFQKLLAAVGNKDWDGAVAEMLDSKWATQVGVRATELAAIMRAGTYQE